MKKRCLTVVGVNPEAERVMRGNGDDDGSAEARICTYDKGVRETSAVAAVPGRMIKSMG